MLLLSVFVVLCAFVISTVADGVLVQRSTCGTTPVDIQFLLDSSGSIGSSNFIKLKKFVANFALSLTIGTSNVQIGVTTFSSTVHPQFYMNEHNSTASLVNAINAIPYQDGGTVTGAALNWVDKNAFTTAAGNRDHVIDIVIVMTDGKSANTQETAAAAAQLHGHNVKTFAVGIGNKIDQPELQSIASDSKHILTVSSFDTLHTLQTQLENDACNLVTGSTPSTGPTDLCSSHPCQNNGRCLSDMQGYVCLCSGGHTGKNCESGTGPTTTTGPTDFCASHPCQNNGRCLSDLNGHVCLCSSGYTGKNCENDICSTHPCKNNGRCLEDSQGYICLCGKGFTGKYCESVISQIIGKK